MWQKFIEFIRKLFNNNKQLSSSFLLSDEEVERRLEQQENNLKLLHETIGSNPLDQIDWIIENGYDEYHEKYKSYQDGSIGKKEEVEFNVGDMVTNVGEHHNKSNEEYESTSSMYFERVKKNLEYEREMNTKRFKLSVQQARDFHKKSNKGTPLDAIYRQVEKELGLYNIEFNTDNESILSEILEKAIKYFSSCETSLELDDDKIHFQETLENEEIIIISKWMSCFYTENLIKMNERLTEALSSKGYHPVTGSADVNLQQVYEELRELARAEQLSYSFEEIFEIRGGIDDTVLMSFGNRRNNTYTVFWENGKVTREENVVIATDNAIKEFNIPPNNRVGRSTGENRVEALNQSWLICGYDYPIYFSKPLKGHLFKVGKEYSFQTKENNKVELQKNECRW